MRTVAFTGFALVVVASVASFGDPIVSRERLVDTVFWMDSVDGVPRLVLSEPCCEDRVAVVEGSLVFKGRYGFRLSFRKVIVVGGERQPDEHLTEWGTWELMGSDLAFSTGWKGTVREEGDLIWITLSKGPGSHEYHLFGGAPYDGPWPYLASEVRFGPG